MRGPYWGPPVILGHDLRSQKSHTVPKIRLIRLKKSTAEKDVRTVESG